jgi:hypothetical protein
VLACLAGSVTAQGFLVVPAIVVAHWFGRRTATTWRLVGGDVLVAAATTVAAGLLVRDGFGWIPNVGKQFSAHTPYSIATAIAKLMTPIVRGASYDDLAAGARITTITAMICTVGYLLATARQRALERTAGYSFLALALLAPVLYPWYLLWGTLCLAATASGTRRITVLAVCASGCLLIPPGFVPTTANIITGVALAAVAVTTAVVVIRRRPSGAPRPAVSAGG